MPAIQRRARVAGLLLAGAVLLLAGCALTSPPAGSGFAPPSPHPTRAPSAPIEDTRARAEMSAHLQAVWPEVKHGLTDPNIWGDSPLSPAMAAHAQLGTPTIDWQWTGGIPQGTSAWLGLAPLGDRIIYFIPVLVDGRPMALLGTDNQGGRWSVWSRSTRTGSLAKALTDITAALGSADYELCFVDYDSWLLARKGNRVVGVMVNPVWDHRNAKPPVGVLEGAVLREWLDHPMGT